MSWKGYNEAVEVIERRFQFFPQSFRWRGRRYEVDAVERSWTAARPTSRRYFRARCAAGLFDLYQDLTASTWHLQRVRWASEPTRSLWAVVKRWKFSGV